MRTFYDIENNVTITEAELQASYEELRRNEETDCESFEVYVRECTGKNGALEEIKPNEKRYTCDTCPGTFSKSDMEYMLWSELYTPDDFHLIKA